MVNGVDFPLQIASTENKSEIESVDVDLRNTVPFLKFDKQSFELYFIEERDAYSSVGTFSIGVRMKYIDG